MAFQEKQTFSVTIAAWWIPHNRRWVSHQRSLRSTSAYADTINESLLVFSSGYYTTTLSKVTFECADKFILLKQIGLHSVIGPDDIHMLPLMREVKSPALPLFFLFTGFLKTEIPSVA